MSGPVIHVFTDVGVKDTDDELLIKYLCSLKNCPLDLTFVFMGSDGITASDALAYWIREFESNVLSSVNPSSSISYLTIAEYKEYDVVSCDYALQIAPMNGYAGENLTVLEKYIFAGDYATPEGVRDSFNKEGSQDILDRFQEQDKLVDIPSAHMVNMRFNEELLSKFTGAFHDNIVFTAFKLAFGRMHPKCPVASRFAEGLVNPVKGRGVNYKSVMTMAEKLGIVPTHGPSTPYSPESVRYFTEIFGEEWVENQNKYVNPLSVNGCSIDLLTQMNDVLYWINIKAGGDTNIFEQNGGEVFYSSFNIDTIPELLIPSWEYFKENSTKLIDCYNPVYDLFAGYVLVGFIKRVSQRVSHTPEEFLTNVVYEF
jgi:hypothetical protein